MEQVPLWVSLTQIGASIFLGLSALVVAVLGLRWSYRNNFGWDPVAFIKEFKITNTQQRSDEAALCHIGQLSLEFWNRRKYPIIIRSMQVDFKGVTLRQSKHPPADWHIRDTTMRRTKDVTVTPTSHQTFSIHIPYLVDTTGEIQTPMSVDITYYDPRRNKEGCIRLEARYSFTAQRKVGPVRAIPTPPMKPE